MKKLFVILAVALGMNAKAQIDVTDLLFSKMDMVPQHLLWDGEETMLMGYTTLMGAPIDIPGPTLVYTEGDSVELQLRNMSQGVAHTIHLHGLDVDQWNDGVPHLSFDVGHNETKSYFFKAPHPGTYIYHCHVVSSIHVQAGMYGMLIVKPTDESLTWGGGYSFKKEYAWMMSELDTVWHHDSIINAVHDTTTHMVLLPQRYEPQYFLVNGRSEYQLEDTTVAAMAFRANETILLRLANIGYYGNTLRFPMHLNARIISSDGRPLPTMEFSDSLVLLPGERYQVLLQATNAFSGNISVEYFDLNTQLVHNTQTIPVEAQASAQLEDEDRRVCLHPNPVSDRLLVENIEGRLCLYDMQGKLIQEAFFEGLYNVLDVSSLRAGMYLIKTDKQTVKIIKE